MNIYKHVSTLGFGEMCIENYLTGYLEIIRICSQKASSAGFTK
jgi:hypothetical protein